MEKRIHCKTLGFLRRNVNINSTSVKESAYKTLVRPLVEYSSSVWDPHIHVQKDITRLEMVQRRAARYVSNKHGNRSSVDNMLHHLNWDSLEHRRRIARLVMFYKIVNELVAIDKSRLTPPIRRTRHTHDLAYQLPSCTSDYRKYSYFPRTIKEWNSLPPGIVSAKTPDAFKAQVSVHAF